MKLNSKQTIRIKQSLYKLALLSFVVVVIWIGFEIYWSYNKTGKTASIKKKIDPISSNLYVGFAENLSQRLHIPPEDLEAFKPIAKQKALQLKKQAEAESDSLGRFSPHPPSASPSALLNQ